MIDIACYLANCKLKGADVGYQRITKDGTVKYIGGGGNVTNTMRKHTKQYERIMYDMVTDEFGEACYIDNYDIMNVDGDDILQGTIAIVLEYVSNDTYMSINNTDVRHRVNSYLNKALYRKQKALKTKSIEAMQDYEMVYAVVSAAACILQIPKNSISVLTAYSVPVLLWQAA